MATSTLPSWADFDTVKTITIVIVGVAAVVALGVLFLVKRWTMKLLVIVLLAVGAGFAWHYHAQMDEVRRRNCNKLVVFGYRVPTPACTPSA